MLQKIANTFGFPNKENLHMIYTTLARIREHEPCTYGWKKLCKTLGGISKYGKDTPVSLLQILDSNGLDDALWCLRACDDEAVSREVARRYALQVVHRWEPPAVVLEYLNTGNEALREAAWHTAWDAEWYVAWDAVRDTARAAARAAARGSAWYAAWGAAWYARDAGATLGAQTQHLRDMLKDCKGSV